MTQHIELDYLDPVHEGFFDAIQEVLGASVPSLKITVQNSTTLQATAGSGNSQAAVAIEGRYRFRTTATTAALPGGLTNGVGDVYVTGSDNDFTGVVGDPDSPTDYNFYLSIVASGGDPGTAIKRQIGYVDVVSSAITAFRPIVGWRHNSTYPLLATSDHASQVALTARGAASQTADLFRVEESTGTAALRVDSDGDILATQGVTISSTEGLVISANGGKDTINLSDTTADVGITIGGDVTLYRSAANVLKTDDSLQSAVDITARVGSSAAVVIGDEGPSAQAGISANADTVWYRNAADTWRTPDNVIIDQNLTVTGSVDIGGSLTIGGGSIIGSGSTAGGDLSGTFSNLQIVAGAVTTTEILDGTILNADISASAAIALSKLATDPLARANHTGTQTASTISNFDTQVRTSRLDQMAAPTANVTWNGVKITNLADATAGSDAMNRTASDARYGQLGAANTWTFTNSFHVGTDSVALSVRRGTDTTPTAAIFRVQNNAGSTSYLLVDKDGNTSTAGQLQADKGNVGNPGIAFTGDLNTGLYQLSANENAIHFSANGSEKMEINTSGVDINDALTIGGAFDHNGSTFGAFGATPAARPTTRTNSSGLTATSTLVSGFTLNQLAQYVLGLRDDLITLGLLQ